MIPTGAQAHLFTTPAFYAGLAYVCLPLNVLLYVMNDMMDVETDADNPRKGGWFGAKLSKPELRRVAVVAIALQPFCLFVLAGSAGLFKVITWFASFVAVNTAYNVWPKFSDKPPFDLLLPFGYLLCMPLSVMVNGAPPIPFRSWLHGALLVLRVQILTEFLDIEPDSAVGRRTSMVALGREKASGVLLVVGILELQSHVHLFPSNIFLAIFSVCSVFQVVAMLSNAEPMQKAAGVGVLVFFLLAAILGWRWGSFVDFPEDWPWPHTTAPSELNRSLGLT